MSPYENLWARFLAAKSACAAVMSCQHIADALSSQYSHGISK